jgi:hypothetical protein
MATYNPEDLINKTIFAQTKINAYKAADKQSQILYTFQPGATVGIVYSFVQKPDGLWWMFRYRPNPNVNAISYFVKNELNQFNKKDLESQGLLSTKEKAEAEAEKDKSILDKIFDFGKKSATGIIIVLLAVYAYNKTQTKK